MVSKGRRSAVPSAALAFLAPPPLIAGEDHAAYDDLLARISAALQPGDILEDIWVRDVVDMVWDALRLRRLKTQLLTASAYEGMHAILYRFLDWQFSEQVARQWALRDQAAVTKAEAVLASAGLTTESVIAQTLALKIDVIERVDRMVMAEARRNSVLREIERHRASFARTARRVVQDAEDAEEIEGPGCKLIGADEAARERASEVPA
ncbi:MAG: hypothetical protein ACXWI3_12455 [Croceibacterium sp.]